MVRNLLNTLSDNYGARKRRKNLGRGIGSGKGKTSGRGGKGQTARSGVALNGFEGGQMPIYRRLPKRGFRSHNREAYVVINIKDVEILIGEGRLDSKSITLQNLKELGICKKNDSKIKLLAKGGLVNSFNIEVHAASKAAEELLIKAGGKINIITKM